MVLKNTLRAVSLIAVFAVPMASYAAFDAGVAKADVTDAIARLVSKYEARIAELEAENASLKAQLASGKSSTGMVSVTAPAASGQLGPAPLDDEPQTAKPTVTPSKPAVTATGASTGNAEYDAVIRATNAALPSILKENGLPETAQLGLYEFVSGQKAFFVSIDDGKNPAGVTAFKTKILFTYDSKYATTVAGIFDLNYDVQRYKTTFGSNPFAASARVRVKNPAYTGKLLEESATAPASTGTSGSASSTATTTTTTSSTTTTVTADVTAKAVRAAYDKNKLADAIKLANVYLAKNPNDVDILTVRYRSLYITGKFADSLKDVAAIEALQGSKFDCTIAKDAAFIAKSAKDTAAATKYSAIVTACKK